MSENVSPFPQERAGGAPEGNRNAATHGLHSAKAALNHFGRKAINGRTRAGREWHELYRALALEHGGEASLNRVQRADVEIMTTLLWLIRKTDAYLVSLDSIVLKRQKVLVPIITERNELVAAYQRHRRDLQKLRLTPRPDQESKLEDLFKQDTEESDAL
jgi:hypothetical protein